jgi:glycosyltransferase involved in cell wall biosynthesis
MHVLFIHQNFPGQFRHIAAHLAASERHVVVAMGEKKNLVRDEAQIAGVKLAGYELSRTARPTTHQYLHGPEENILRGQAVVRTCLQLKQQGFNPQLIVTHAGWGEALFLRDIFPEARILGYFEFYYHAEGKDVGFDPEFPTDFDRKFLLRIRNATHLLAWTNVDWGWSPTQWQKSLFPDVYQPQIEVIHEGVDTTHIMPNPHAKFTLPNGQVLTKHDEVLTIVNRALEPYRGFHVFMRALPEIQRQRPNAITVIVGSDKVGYGAAPKNASNWREAMLAEVGEQLDLSRVHFVGNLAYGNYLRLLQVSRAHTYLTYPFVLSWSMLEAMATGCTLLASATPPVLEVIKDQENGLLFDFFDVAKLTELAVAVLAEPERFEYLGVAARATIIERYDLKTVILPAQIKFINRLLHG